ncbi:hypothetical protein U8037_001586 [Stenotrophomonas maltophilia]|nr:hypothetical protein [Stenotrophomonas maltophilia]MBH1451549.1 hypothetical protein [Stenotrophomonas maltophilia]MBH1566514.1 hypothetical protein [Stenotrophomonas maltophilia]MBH1727937.1 hypothetical protein [Stenotrophomonas maltophilia]MBK5592340.1 hypothetical protein [Stenotrophomonas maltophilia]
MLGWLACVSWEASLLPRVFPAENAMNARHADHCMSTCRTHMNSSAACATRASARSFTGVHADVAAHPRMINHSLQTMATSTAFREWLWRSDMAQQNQNQNPNQKQQGQQNQQDQQQGRGRDQQQQQQQEQQQRNQRNQQQGGQDEEE